MAPSLLGFTRLQFAGITSAQDALIGGTGMSKLLQIKDDDLATLERTLPRLADALMMRLDNRLRTQLREVQQILSNVRWNYGPPSEVEIVPPEGDDHSRT